MAKALLYIIYVIKDIINIRQLAFESEHFFVSEGRWPDNIFPFTCFLNNTKEDHCATSCSSITPIHKIYCNKLCSFASFCKTFNVAVHIQLIKEQHHFFSKKQRAESWCLAIKILYSIVTFI